MSKIELCNTSDCSACKACLNKCSKNAISMHKNSFGHMFPIIDESKCIECGLCQKVCPSLNKVDMHRPLKVYAAWSKDNNERFNSASGGMAAELCKLMVQRNAFFSGVRFDKSFLAYQDLYSSLDYLTELKNSKYVYSDMRDTYKKVLVALKQKHTVLFIGTPCQCAGIKNYIPSILQDKLYIVDLICHGMCPQEYLYEHIRHIEKKTNRKAKRVSFRDPDLYTYTYTFTLMDIDNDVFYRKKVYRNDVYQIGYHQRLIYNEHCYSCKYACAERCTDLTIGDFSGLGRIKPIQYEFHNVSCVLVNTKKGNELLEDLKRNNSIFVDERPLDEALKYEQQLQRASVAHINRKKFLELYPKYGFEKAARIALRREIIKNEVRYYLKLAEFRAAIGRILPRQIKDLVKYLIKV